MLKTAEDFRKTMPEGVLTGEFPGYKGFFKKTGTGWVHAKKALMAAADEAQKLGAKFITGSPEGQVTELEFEDGDVIGARTADGKLHRCDHLILCAGANSYQLLDFKDQLRPTAWTLAHIKLTEEEIKLYRNLPVLFNIEKGFFMEPDEDKHEVKVCDEHPGYCNWTTGPDGKLCSIPFTKDQIPKEAENRIRNSLKDTLPHLAERPFIFTRICWCADTPDREFLISGHPQFKSLTVAAGDSGYGFVHIPVIGQYVLDSIEGKLDEHLAKGRFGGTNRVMDFEEVAEWTTIGTRS